MGREADTEAAVGAVRAPVKALLESRELILRGALRRRWPLADLAGVRVAGETLAFTAQGEPVVLHLGAAEAAAWAKKIATPPPTLAAKLGIGPAAPAWVVGTVDDPALAAALADATAARAADAALLLAVVRDGRGLADAQAACGRLTQCRHAWLVYPKGRAADPGDAAIRSAMRAAGWGDTKACAVSDTLTATRYSRAAG